MREANAREQRAGLLLWSSAAIAFTLYLALNRWFFVPAQASNIAAVTMVLASLFWPLVAVGASRLWNHHRSQRTAVKVFAIACLACSAIVLLSGLFGQGYWQRWMDKEGMTAEDFKKQAGKCLRLQNLECAEANWRDYNRLRPGDPVGQANLGFVLNARDKHAEAVEEFKKAIALGEGAYDLFAYHADSLAKLGDSAQAIEWSYKALAAAPNLVDVRGKLAKLLVGANRPYEAMALLQSYDAQLETRGQPSYFSGQRIAIETSINQSENASGVEKKALRLPAFAGHYFAPVTLGDSKPRAFMVDTGATRTTFSEALLRDSRASYRVTHDDVKLTTADGRKVNARAIVIDSMFVGRFRLSNVSAMVCAGCASLLGQSTLSGFDLQSSKSGGMEFLTMVQRGP